MKKNANAKIHLPYSDVFKASLLNGAEFSSVYNFPLAETVEEVPRALIPFNKMKKFEKNAKDYYVHFFLPDAVFERVWRSPETYIPLLKKFKGCIMPDFSLYRDMPYAHQLYNCFRNRVLGFIFAKNGINVIANLSFSDERSYDFASEGLPRRSLIAVGNLGTMRNAEDRDVFHRALFYNLGKLEPRILLVYGSSSPEIEHFCQEREIELHVFSTPWDGSFVAREVRHG